MLGKFVLAFALLLFQNAVIDCPSCIVVAQSTPQFFYVVTTVDSNGFESAFSNEVTATFAQGQKNVVLTWTAATIPPLGAGIAGYNVWRSKVKGGSYTKISAALVAGVTYTDSFVPPNAASGLAATVN